MRSHRKRAKIKRLRKRDGDNCFYCNNIIKLFCEPYISKQASVPNRGSIEHIFDVKHGGSNDLINLVLAHANCNSPMGNETLLHKLLSAKHPRAKYILEVILSIFNKLEEMGFKNEI
jgi:5-methylcytosine-specific restriction endonuclease McrA